MEIIRYFIIVAFIAAFAGCDPWADINNLQDERNKNLFEILVQNPDLSTFVTALEKTGYTEKLSADMSFTVFAPTNAALSNINLNDTAALMALVKNHISEKIVYSDKTGIFAIDRILMLNGKYATTINNLVSGIPVSKWNIASKNGVLHYISGTITDRKNSWEYLQTLQGDPVVEFIASFNEKVMDMSRSIQTGVNANGKPVYDTIWTYRNTLLDASPLAKESSTSTFLLLEQSGLNELKAKYSKYFNQKDSVQMYQEIMKEIVTDMFLPYTKINASGRFLNFSEVLVDVNKSDISDSIITSNGIIYKIKSAKVKMYQNKIKPLLIEAEDFENRWPDAWQTRPRTWASGGKDVLLKSRTRHSYGWPVQSTYELNTKTPAGKDTVVIRDTVIVNRINNLYSFNYRSENEWPGSNALGEPNAYISYKPKMYSTAYKIFWKAYDDNAEKNHIDARGVPMVFYQKMYISFPGEKPLQRTSANVITGHFSSTAKPGFIPNHTILAARMTAGENVESQLVRYRVNLGHNVYLNSYILFDANNPNNPQPITSEDIYGKEGILICPHYGPATLFVSNTCLGEFTHHDGTVQAYLQANKAANAAGMIFLDYIRLEPQVDPND
jgi:uncharacterized surface protein with fasciclin (FAS1) repeats